jgi:L-ascorbate metabolism protein UlaG (beta-lactamase superfamily)
MTLLILATLVVIFIIAYQLFMRFAPQIGAPPSGVHLEQLKTSENYTDGIFVNQIPTNMNFSLVEGLKITWDIITAKGTTPSAPLPTRFSSELALPDTLPRLTWFGHSAFLLEVEGKRILIDPMLGPASSPLPIFGKRFPYEQPIDFGTITDIDAVIFSHDHYDHLDYYTIQKIKEEVGHFYVPLGVGSHLRRWGVAEEDITELDWWDETQFEEFTLVATPARHFSGRGTGDRAKTLWASWVIKGQNNAIYFSGDGGYGPHFEEIGDRYGPFDFAMIECGQYNEKWAAIHMMPEESVQAGIDLKAEVIMPIHWGAFSLALHPWKEPANRLDKAINKLGVKAVYPYIGEPMVVGRDFPTHLWWRDVK